MLLKLQFTFIIQRPLILSGASYSFDTIVALLGHNMFSHYFFPTHIASFFKKYIQELLQNILGYSFFITTIVKYF